jgi:hypothetical protein
VLLASAAGQYVRGETMHAPSTDALCMLECEQQRAEGAPAAALSAAGRFAVPAESWLSRAAVSFSAFAMVSFRS